MSNENEMSGQKKGHREPFALRQAALARRLDALFRAMSTDFLLREQFVTDPAQITSEYLYGTRISPQKASTTNQLVFSLMSNHHLLNWLRTYFISNRVRPPSRQKFIRDFGRAVCEHGGQHIVLALIRSDVAKDGIFSEFDEAFLHALQSLFFPGLSDGTDETGTDSTGTDSTGTDETGTDSTGTDSTGTDSTGTSVTGTDSTGTSPTGTLITDVTLPGTQSTFTGITLSTFITQQTDTTNVTTPFTRDPTTTLTTLFEGQSYVLVALEALAQYATLLSESGALEFVWSE